MREIVIWSVACLIVAIILLVMWPGRDNRSLKVEAGPSADVIGSANSK